MSRDNPTNVELFGLRYGQGYETPPRHGKTRMMNKAIEEALDQGITVAVVSAFQPMELRGAGVAKDITPTTLRIEKK